MVTSRSRTASALLAALAALFLTQCQTPTPDGASGGNADPAWPDHVPREIVFARDVKPILEIRCLECHNHINAPQSAGLNLETRKLAMTTGRSPSVIIPGDPENSLFIKVLKLHPMHPTNMPPAPDKIWGVRMQILKKWIRDGADWPADVRLVRPQDWAQ